MAEVKKARLFLRRGTDTDRQSTVLCQGELGYSTDAFRVFVGDASTAGGKSLGSFMYVSGGAHSASFHTRLTTASADGRAHKGDLAVFPAQNYNNAKGVSVTPHASASTVMILTADVTAGGTEGATPGSWVAVNSGIPFGNIDVLDDDISGDKIHGGSISGPIAISGGKVNIGGDSSDEKLVLSGTYLSAATLPTNDLVYPLGLTSAAELTCVNSILDFGAPATNVSIGNAGGYMHATSTATNSAVSAYATSNGEYNFHSSTGSTHLSGAKTTHGEMVIWSHAGYIGNGGAYADGTGNSFLPGGSWSASTLLPNCAIAEFTWGIGQIRGAVGDTTASLSWSQIKEFYFSTWMLHGDDRANFIGYHNNLTKSNEIACIITNGIKDGKYKGVQHTENITIPNTFNGSDADTERLIMHLGIATTGTLGIVMTGLRVNI